MGEFLDATLVADGWCAIIMLMKRISIFGSCVSRDALAAFPERAQLGAYVARSSLVSACADRSRELEVLVEPRLRHISSPFQRRMVTHDVFRTGLSELGTDEASTLLVDFIDERLNLWLLPSGPLTVSNEFLRTGLVPDRTQVLDPAHPLRWRHWIEAVERFGEVLGGKRLILNRVYWAALTTGGDSLRAQFAVDANNAMLERMYNEAHRRVRFAAEIEYSPSILVADPTHRWGLSPFHYGADFYTATMEQLGAAMALHTD